MDTQTRDTVLSRDRFACVVCGLSVQAKHGSVHHRRPRGMGGTKKKDTPANLITVCGDGTKGCHEWIEMNRAEATEYGYLVSARETPKLMEVKYWDDNWYLLDDYGEAEPSNEDFGSMDD